MVVLLQDGNAAEHVHPLCVERATGVVVSTFAHHRKFEPFVVFDVKHFYAMSGSIHVLPGARDNHECVRECADGVTVARVNEVLFLFKCAHGSALIV